MNKIIRRCQRRQCRLRGNDSVLLARRMRAMTLTMLTMVFSASIDRCAIQRRSLHMQSWAMELTFSASRHASAALMRKSQRWTPGRAIASGTMIVSMSAMILRVIVMGMPMNWRVSMAGADSTSSVYGYFRMIMTRMTVVITLFLKQGNESLALVHLYFMTIKDGIPCKCSCSPECSCI